MGRFVMDALLSFSEASAQTLISVTRDFAAEYGLESRLKVGDKLVLGVERLVAEGVTGGLNPARDARACMLWRCVKAAALGRSMHRVSLENPYDFVSQMDGAQPRLFVAVGTYDPGAR